MNLTQARDSLKDSGFNIFLSAKISTLPQDLSPLSFCHDQQNKTLCLLASGGKNLWEKLPHPLKVETNPIDSYTKSTMLKFAHDFLDGEDIEILYPEAEPKFPLQKLGRALNLCHQSPIGLDIHSDYGLWFAFRGVFITSKNLLMPTLKSKESPCDTCIEKPCMTFADINTARLSCPIKSEHRYSNEQLAYHHQALGLLKF